MMEGKTSVVTEHRLSTVRPADIIFVLDEGVIASSRVRSKIGLSQTKIEKGTHGKLVARGGLYSRLYRLQSSTSRSSGWLLEPKALVSAWPRNRQMRDRP
jgi:ABC-type multidrug transport system fused ATPase/permease subunit